MAGYNLERMAVVLAGGDGSRLSGLVRNMTGHRVPKQFCSLLGDPTMLECTRRRVEMAVAPERIVFVVSQAHEQHYGPLLRDIRGSNLVVQPEDKGSAPAIVMALLRAAAMEPDASVAIFPADHFISDERDFMRHVEIAYDAVEQRPEFTVLLGMEPSNPDGGYGWIEPAERIGLGKYDLFRIGGLWNQPGTDQAMRLLKRGCWWNSAVTVGRLSAILAMIMVAAPQLYAAFEPLRTRLAHTPSPRQVASVYQDLPATSFSRQVLGSASAPVNLAALPVARVRWADLSEPQRVRQVWNQLGFKPLWSIGS
jgi:mannose-1-phosphate guanylyltransferase